MRTLLLLMPFLLAVSDNGPAQADDAVPPQAKMAVEAFRSLCAAAPRDYDALVAQAEALKFEPLSDGLRHQAGGITIRDQEWRGGTDEAHFDFSVNEMKNPRNRSEACNITVYDVDVEPIRNQLISTLRLQGTPEERHIGSSTTYSWTLTGRPDTRVFLNTGSLAGKRTARISAIFNIF
jgi:hypothetical protein